MEKKLHSLVISLSKANPQAHIRVWAEDEHRLGLQPVCRRVWTPIGERTTREVNLKYQWLWLVGFVEPNSGETYWWTVPKLNHQVFSLLLKDFAEHYQLGEENQCVLVVDGASFHRSKQVKVPQGLHLCFLPPYTPELQPVERLWPLTNEVIANRSFELLDELEEVTLERCRGVMKQTGLVKGLTQFHWWAIATMSD